MKMRKSATSKIALSITGVVFVVLGFLCIAIDFLFRDVLVVQMETTLKAQAQQYAQLIEAGNHGTMEMICTQAQDVLFVVNSKGRVVGQSLSGMKFNLTDFDNTIILQAVAGKAAVHMGYVPQLHKSGVLVVEPIRRGSIAGNTLVLFRSYDILQSTFSQVRKMLLISAILAIMLTVALSLFLSKYLIRPLTRMESAAHRMSQGQFQTRILVRGQDEVARLGNAINHLGDSLHYLETSRKKFLADISHELRTPLSYIQGYSEVLLKKNRSEDEQQRYLQTIHDESVRIGDLVQNLFALAKSDEGILRVERIEASMTGIVDSVIKRIHVKTEEKGILVTREGLANVIGRFDPLRIEQVLFNLLDNAIRHTPSGGNISVLVRTCDDKIHVQVSDSGSGISEAELPYVWERLYRVEKSRSRVYGGSGIGLTVVKQIIELHEGTVFIQSHAEEGTKVSFDIPQK